MEGGGAGVIIFVQFAVETFLLQCVFVKEIES